MRDWLKEMRKHYEEAREIKEKHERLTPPTEKMKWDLAFAAVSALIAIAESLADIAASMDRNSIKYLDD